MSEAKRLAEERLREIVAMPFDALLRFIDDPTDGEVTARSGRTYRARTVSFWDMEPSESDLFTRVTVTGRGLRWYQRYSGVDVREPGTDSSIDPSADLGVSSTWTTALAWILFALFLLALAAPWFVGTAYLISRVV